MYFLIVFGENRKYTGERRHKEVEKAERKENRSLGNKHTTHKRQTSKTKKRKELPKKESKKLIIMELVVKTLFSIELVL